MPFLIPGANYRVGEVYSDMNLRQQALQQSQAEAQMRARQAQAAQAAQQDQYAQDMMMKRQQMAQQQAAQQAAMQQQQWENQYKQGELGYRRMQDERNYNTDQERYGDSELYKKTMAGIGIQKADEDRAERARQADIQSKDRELAIKNQTEDRARAAKDKQAALDAQVQNKNTARRILGIQSRMKLNEQEIQRQSAMEQHSPELFDPQLIDQLKKHQEKLQTELDYIVNTGSGSDSGDGVPDMLARRGDEQAPSYNPLRGGWVAGDSPRKEGAANIGLPPYLRAPSGDQPTPLISAPMAEAPKTADEQYYAGRKALALAKSSDAKQKKADELEPKYSASVKRYAEDGKDSLDVLDGLKKEMEAKGMSPDKIAMSLSQSATYQEYESETKNISRLAQSDPVAAYNQARSYMDTLNGLGPKIGLKKKNGADAQDYNTKQTKQGTERDQMIANGVNVESVKNRFEDFMRKLEKSIPSTRQAEMSASIDPASARVDAVVKEMNTLSTPQLSMYADVNRGGALRRNIALDLMRRRGVDVFRGQQPRMPGF